MYRELKATGAPELSFRTDGFILKISVPIVAEKVAEKVAGKVAEKLPEKLPENRLRLAEKVIEKAESSGEKLSKNKISILKLISENPYISRAELAKEIRISDTSVYRNIEAMRGKYIRRVGPDKGGFWEILI